MLGTILSISLLSFIIIYVFHQIFVYLTETLTTTKIKNYQPTQTYQSILNTLRQPPPPLPNSIPNPNIVFPNNTTPIAQFDDVSNQLPNNIHEYETQTTMEDELKLFMKQQLLN
ncbi:hypothetical protein N9K75_01070 [bacterium]|nr:hypothetical protein [bacterium]|tara:strand:- start:648 stop:989 length:342 start_codon:yes stop_codon:yes gene_type:complete